MFPKFAVRQIENVTKLPTVTWAQHTTELPNQTHDSCPGVLGNDVSEAEGQMNVACRAHAPGAGSSQFRFAARGWF